MTITAHKIPTTDYRENGFSLITAKPGKVTVSMVILHSLDETEEFITALREAAKEAELPQSAKTQ